MFGGEEGFKNARHIFQGDAAAGVGNVHADETAAFYRLGAETVWFKQCFFLSGDGKRALFVHCVFGIDAEVQDDLKKLDFVNFDAIEVFAVAEF